MDNEVGRYQLATTDTEAVILNTVTGEVWFAERYGLMAKVTYPGQCVSRVNDTTGKGERV